MSRIKNLFAPTVSQGQAGFFCSKMSKDKNLVPLPKKTRTLCHCGLDCYLNIIMTKLKLTDRLKTLKLVEDKNIVRLPIR
jgi:hypothetical protein